MKVVLKRGQQASLMPNRRRPFQPAGNLASCFNRSSSFSSSSSQSPTRRKFNVPATYYHLRKNNILSTQNHSQDTRRSHRFTFQRPHTTKSSFANVQKPSVSETRSLSFWASCSQIIKAQSSFLIRPHRNISSSVVGRCNKATSNSSEDTQTQLKNRTEKMTLSSSASSTQLDQTTLSQHKSSPRETTIGERDLNKGETQTSSEGEMSLLQAYMSLSKARLASLVVASTAVGYFMAPPPSTLVLSPIGLHSAITEKTAFSVETSEATQMLMDWVLYNGQWLTDPKLFATTFGTALTVASANTFNQVLEVEHDAKMRRTGGRVLPTGRLSVQHALFFGLATGALGTGILCTFVNWAAATLAFSNILLYVLVYTPLKRVHWINTWVGAVVGAIPPVIGWVAATDLWPHGPGVWTLAALLFIWQIPHFLALAHMLREDYGRAGYKMLSTTMPATSRVLPMTTLIFSLMLVPLGVAAWAEGVTSHWFMADAALCAGTVVWPAIQFLRDEKMTRVAARRVFLATLAYLPLVLIFMMLHKTEEKTDEE